MDVLSEVLQVVRLTGAVHLNAEFTHPWCVRSAPRLLAARLNLAADSIIAFHVIAEGGCLIDVPPHAPFRVEAGDVVVFPRGDQHTVASDLSLEPVPVSKIYPEPGPSLDRLTMLSHGGGGTPSRLVCGFLRSDQGFNPLWQSLPVFLCVRVRNGGLVLETPTDAGTCVQPIAEPH